jgi:hypothetical protein
MRVYPRLAFVRVTAGMDLCTYGRSVRLPLCWLDVLEGDVVSRRRRGSGVRSRGKNTRGEAVHCDVSIMSPASCRKAWITATRWLVKKPPLWVAADEGAARKEAARSSGSGTNVTLRYRAQKH